MVKPIRNDIKIIFQFFKKLPVDIIGQNIVKMIAKPKILIL